MAPESLSPRARRRLRRLRDAEDLAALRELTGAETVHDAYFAAKDEWRRLRDRALPAAPRTTETLPGVAVDVDDARFHVHGITHADTDAERAHVRRHVQRYLEREAAVYCEEGVRRMYLDDVPGACAMDDYRWAIARCREIDVETSLLPTDDRGFDGLLEDVTSAASEVREVAYAIVHAGADVYGEQFGRALGDVAASFLMSHEDAGTARDYEAFRRSRRAAEDPALLGDLQRYYRIVFLPQPIEREWLRRHDPALELLSHARNERLADYAVFDHDDADVVHLVVGAAHLPGVTYYLRRHRDGQRDVVDFEPMP